MFLANLNDTQKDAFMTLAYKLIAVDGVLDEGELAMMAQYKLEMNLPSDYDETQGNLETALAAFTAEPDAVKKQIMFELVGLACAGDDYENEEYTLIEQVRTAFDLRADFPGKCEVYISELKKLYEKIGTLVGK